MVRIALILGLVLCPLVAADTYGASLQGRERQPQPGAEEPKEFKVNGTVVNRDGEPQKQAEVSFDGPKSGKTWTDGSGSFRFEGPAGDYRVTVRIGGKSQTFQVKITESGLQPSELEFREG